MSALSITAARGLCVTPERLTLPEGATILGIVAAALPGLPAAAAARVRVVLINERGAVAIDPALWRRVRPRAGAQVLVRLVPGGDALKSVLGVLVSIAAFAIGQFWLGPWLASATGLSQGLATGLATAGLALAGNFLLSMLFKPKDPEKEKPSYAIGAFRNEARPDAPVPLILGRMRVAPPFAASTYTEIVGDDMYLRCLFAVGYGPLALTDLKIGDTPLSNYTGVELEVRTGFAGDAPVTLYPRQVIENAEPADLTRPLPRDEVGEIVEGAPSIETPVVRVTAADVSQIGIIVGFPAGLIFIDKKGRQKNGAVQLRIEMRAIGTVPWTLVTVLDIRAKRREALYRQHFWDTPARARYEVRLTRLTDDRDDPSISDRSVLVALQSYRWEQPIAFQPPLAKVAVRIKATHQLNGQLDRFNLVASSIMPDWDAGTQVWVTRETRNPASHLRRLLQGPAARYPVADDALDLPALQEWHEFCTAKGLKYDRLHDFEGSLLEQLAAVAAAGRAAPRHDGRKWSVVIDRPRTLAVDHISERNSRGLRWQRAYVRPPHAHRVPFLDATNDFQPAERIVPWPGHAGDIVVTEELQLPGKTDPAEIWRETRRRQYSAIHRPDVLHAIQDGVARVATRGDLIMGSWPSLDRTLAVARVAAVAGAVVVLDAPVTMAAGQDYAIRFRRFSAEDTIGQSVVRTIATTAGEHGRVTLTGTGAAPAAGDLVLFGPQGAESFALVVAGIEPAEEMSVQLALQPMVPLIDTLTDAEVPPAWDGRVGTIGPADMTPPGIPVFAAVATGYAGTGAAGGLEVTLSPGPGGTTVSYVLNHRAAGAPTWTAIPIAAGSMAASIAGYGQGAAVELMAWAVSPAGVPGTASTIRTVIIGAADAAAPAALSEASIQVVPKLGHVEIVFAVSDAATESVRLLRDGVAIAELPVSAGGTYGRIDGDSTRTNLLAGGWTLGSGWSLGGTTLTKMAGAATSASMGVPLDTGGVYRVGGSATVSSGSAILRFTGGTTVDGPTLGAGAFASAMTAAGGNDHLEVLADPAFAGSVTGLVLYGQTPACLSQGAHTYQLQPINGDGVAGPLSALRNVTVI